MPKKTTRIKLATFDGEYEFQLSLAGMLLIEEKAGCGIGAVYGQILRGRFRMDEGEEFGIPSEGAFSAKALLEIVRQGLIFGGRGVSDGKEIEVNAWKAQALIDAYLSPDHGGNLLDAWNLAAAIMHAAIEGVDVPDETPVKDAPPSKAKAKSGTAAPAKAKAAATGA